MPSTKKEKRLKRIRNVCPQKVKERLRRTCDMYLVEYPVVDWDELKCEFIVLGSTGNVYNTTFGRVPHCTCPDYAKGNTTCKHILFLTTQIMGIDPNDKLAYQAAYIGEELEEMYNQMEDEGIDKALVANKSVRSAYSNSVDDLGAQMSNMRLITTRPPEDEDYVNYGQLQGQRTTRDRSTYRPYHWEKPPYIRYR